MAFKIKELPSSHIPYLQLQGYFTAQPNENHEFQIKQLPGLFLFISSLLLTYHLHMLQQPVAYLDERMPSHLHFQYGHQSTRKQRTIVSLQVYMMPS